MHATPDASQKTLFTAFPAKAGTHRPTALPAGGWIPAFAGTAVWRARDGSRLSPGMRLGYMVMPENSARAAPKPGGHPMKIARIESFIFGTKSSKDLLFCRVETEDRTYGWGEAYG